ncbi:ribbon-helix-helix domain-containing protein [Helicobacter pylori]|uniref:ribbon-helix-helix domain-containing protein n=1 Tax=Helicobacter pylori TaxID=210 RepID=UPI0012E85992|nr:ribbon-helix-helix domain-containing protein [Helicobacter pylori]MUU23505.1 ribbon-helix-helix protein, CopG family [Helicobacter pylori]MUU38296.1 ribbon-helix-helix protein, CopG family [Helicobacter pylori]WQV71233.1 ribbon-helix-helix domain-containing protein [Helicobacter pylori]
MRSCHYEHKQKNFKPKVKTECILFESVLLEILEILKEQEGKSRSAIIERMIIYFLEKEKGNKDETAWKKSKRSYRKTLTNYKKEANVKRRQLQKAKNDEKKKALYICKSSPFSYFRGY